MWPEHPDPQKGRGLNKTMDCSKAKPHSSTILRGHEVLQIAEVKWCTPVYLPVTDNVAYHSGWSTEKQACIAFTHPKGKTRISLAISRERPEHQRVWKFDQADQSGLGHSPHEHRSSLFRVPDKLLTGALPQIIFSLFFPPTCSLWQLDCTVSQAVSHTG